MTKDNIIRMAKEAGFTGEGLSNTQFGTCQLTALEAFAALVRADEREACAKVCDEQANSEYWEGAYATVTKNGHANVQWIFNLGRCNE